MVGKIEARSNLTLDFLGQLIRYEPKTGKFIYLKDVPAAPAKMGDEAGCIVESGYRIIVINRFRLRAHRLAWFIMTGAWPKGQVDHKNLIRSDNSWDNLREATHGQNVVNTKTRASSGFKGVRKQKSGNTYMASITIDGRPKYLGNFKTPQEAHEAYKIAAIARHGEFVRFA